MKTKLPPIELSLTYDNIFYIDCHNKSVRLFNLISAYYMLELRHVVKLTKPDDGTVRTVNFLKKSCSKVIGQWVENESKIARQRRPELLDIKLFIYLSRIESNPELCSKLLCLKFTDNNIGDNTPTHQVLNALAKHCDMEKFYTLSSYEKQIAAEKAVNLTLDELESRCEDDIIDFIDFVTDPVQWCKSNTTVNL